MNLLFTCKRKCHLNLFLKNIYLNICISSINLRIRKKKKKKTRCKHNIHLWHKDNWHSPALKAQLWVIMYCLVTGLCYIVIHRFLPHPQISELAYSKDKRDKQKWTYGLVIYTLLPSKLSTENRQITYPTGILWLTDSTKIAHKIH